jgi:Domain of unknown function (DUF4159)
MIIRYFLKITLFATALFFLISDSNAVPFSIARVHYNGGGDWYSDSSSLVNLQSFLNNETGIETAEKENVVKISDADLFNNPYLYLTGHGNISFSKNEANYLHDYLLGGGFLHVDDNYGLDDSFRRELKKVFPDKELVELPFSHPIYSMLYKFPQGLPKIHEHDGNPPQGLAIIVDNRVVLFYTYECDLGDGWEDVNVHNTSVEKHESALKMGVNIILYCLSGKPVKLP